LRCEPTVAFTLTSTVVIAAAAPTPTDVPAVCGSLTALPNASAEPVEVV